MKRYTYGTMVALMLFGLLADVYQPSASAALDPTPVGTTVIVDDSPTDEADPHISNTLVAYSSVLGSTGSASEIRYHDLVTGAGGVIPGDGADLLPDVSGDIIVFSSTFSYRAAIFAFDSTTGSVTELDARPESNRRRPSIGGSTVSWQDFGLNGENLRPEIVVHDLVTGSTIRLTDDEVDDYRSMVSPDGSAVVWQKCPTGSPTGCDIWQATRTGSAWAVSQLTSGEGDNAWPVTNGEVVVYQSTQDGEMDIAWKPLGGGAEQRLALPGDQRRPAISGDVIVFESGGPAHGSDIMLYELSADVYYPITQTPGISEFLSDISISADGAARVVYTTPSSESLDIHAFTFTLPERDVTPPTLSLPRDLVVNATRPQGARVAYNVKVADDTDPSPGLQCEPPSGSVFPIGTSSVGCTAVDASGNTSGGKFRITVRGAEEQLGDLVQIVEKFDPGHGIAKSLLQQLSNVERQLARGNTDAACDMLNAFIEHVSGLAGTSLTHDQAILLIKTATRIMMVIGCSK